jgi:hypothetical protein
MAIRKKAMKDILDPASKIDTNILGLFIDILAGRPVSTVYQKSHYATKRSFDQGLHQQGCFNLFNSNIVTPLLINENVCNSLGDACVCIKDNSWRKMGNLPVIVDTLGFGIYGQKISQEVYNIIQNLETYHYKDVVEFVKISSSSVLKLISRIDKPESLSRSHQKDWDEIGHWQLELSKIEHRLDSIVKLGDKINHQDILEILENLIYICCDKKMVYDLPIISFRMASCYYYLGAYVDCIMMFDFGFSVAKYTKNPGKGKYLAATWIASSVRKILCSHTNYFIENPNDFDVMYDTVKSFNRNAFEDYRYAPELAIQPMWNLCYLELALIGSYQKTSMENYHHRMNLATDRLYELIHCVKRKNTNFSKTIKSEIIEDLEKISGNVLKYTDDFLDLFNQFCNL